MLKADHSAWSIHFIDHLSIPWLGILWTILPVVFMVCKPEIAAITPFIHRKALISVTKFTSVLPKEFCYAYMKDPPCTSILTLVCLN